MSGRVRAVVCGLLGAGTVGAVVAGLPLLLYHFGGWPLPRHIPDWHEVAAGLMSQDSGAVVLAAVRDCSWLGWLLFTLAVLAEAQAVVRGRPAPRLRLGGLQGTAARLVALAAVTFSAPAAVTLTPIAALAATSHGQVAGHGEAPDPGQAPGHGQAVGSGTAGDVAGSASAGSASWASYRQRPGSTSRYPS